MKDTRVPIVPIEIECIKCGEKFDTLIDTNTGDVEAPYFDKNGKQIKEFALLKVYHFLGVNEQGRGRKHYYMYKWVRLREFKDKKYWVAMHLNNDKDSSYYNLRAVADKQTHIIKSAEIIQQN